MNTFFLRTDVCKKQQQNGNDPAIDPLMVGAARFELAASRSQTVRTTRLCYAPLRFN